MENREHTEEKRRQFSYQLSATWRQASSNSGGLISIQHPASWPVSLCSAVSLSLHWQRDLWI